MHCKAASATQSASKPSRKSLQIAANRYGKGPQGMGLTETEFNIIKGLAMGAGEFLIKQGDHATRVQLPLQGLDDQIAVLSGRERTIRLFDEVGNRLKEFHAARRQREVA